MSLLQRLGFIVTFLLHEDAFDGGSYTDVKELLTATVRETFTFVNRTQLSQSKCQKVTLPFVTPSNAVLIFYECGGWERFKIIDLEKA